MINQLLKVLDAIEFEILNNNSIWEKELLVEVVKPEIKELYEHLKKGETFFKYGKKQRMLVSTYFMTDSFKPLKDTVLGEEILKLQHIYNKFE